MLKKLNTLGFVSSVLSLIAFQLGEGRGPAPLAYAYGLIIIVQVCSHINYKICHNQTAKQGRTQGGWGFKTPPLVCRLKCTIKKTKFLALRVCFFCNDMNFKMI